MHGEDPTLCPGCVGQGTANISPMSVTVGVLKLSCWLNLVAYCQVEKRAYARCRARCGAGRRDGVGQLGGWRKARTKRTRNM